MTAQATAKNRERDRVRALETYHRKVAEDPYAMKELGRGNSRRTREHIPERMYECKKDWGLVNTERILGYQQTYKKRVRLTKKFYCDPCGIASDGQRGWDTHLASEVHKRSIIRVAEGRQHEHRYYHCYKSFEGKQQLAKHITSDMQKEDAAITAKIAQAKAIADNSGAIEAPCARVCNANSYRNAQCLSSIEQYS
jgi:hypothetical protein